LKTRFKYGKKFDKEEREINKEEQVKTGVPKTHGSIIFGLAFE